MVKTLKDVAKKAGVSLATASLALNGSEKVNSETYQKVQEIAEELNYVPNARARALVKRSTQAIGLVIPEIVNPFFAEMAQAIKNRVKEEGFNVIFCSTDYKTQEERRYIKMFRSGQVDGAIFACVGDMMKKNNEMISKLASDNIPVVFVDRDVEGNEMIPVIKCDIKDAAYKATKYLIGAGHRDIGFIGQSKERLEGYKKALQEHNLRIEDDFIYYNYLTIEGGYKIGQELVGCKKIPTAIVSLNDEMAIGLIQSLSGAGVNIPGDVSVFGIDNIRISNFYNPALSTVNIPKKEMGKRAASILLKLIQREEISAQDRYIVYPTELIIRDSVNYLQ